MQLSKERMRLLGAAAIIIIIALALLLSLTLKKAPQRSPQPAPKSAEGKWYIKFSVKDQKSTAYTEEPGAPVAANGKEYFIGGIAVHPRYPVNSGGDLREPILPFGTVIHLEKPIKIQGQEFKILRVMDTGDINYGLWPNYPYWFDVYYGTGNFYNNRDARDYGTLLVNYCWYEEWR